MSFKSRGGGGGGGGEQPSRSSVISQKWALFLCIGSFCVGMLFTNRMWVLPESKGISRSTVGEGESLKLVSEGCNPKFLQQKYVKRESKNILGEVQKSQDALLTLDKTISNLEMELAAAKAAQESILSGSPLSEDMEKTGIPVRKKYFMVVGINTAFSSRKRRDSVRATWMPQGERRRKLEEKGVIIRFVIGHSATVGGILDRAIEAENKKHGDFLRLDHVEGYLELSAKTKSYFATAVSMWDAEYYVKVDDDVHVNIDMYYTSMLMKMSHWELGSLGWMYNILMIEDYAVAPRLIVNGRHRQATYVLPLLIGAAVGFVGLLTESKRFIVDVGKLKTQY
ncbi:OLC1v1024997C5 [Oldenlandia corymbosa var. corymbosa]|uniref:Hexosyltransferase n=1 Tax=Oldenlandia corymbosa var. corymbosa TaxID=529605 RepID=A0AAV1C473_OLDCO|nr:OLC1v1024997C5 [Oldenlandia corymbosa var. corymbosa]